HQFNRFFDCGTAANDIVDDDAGINLALVHVLTERAFSVFLLGPVNLFSVKRIAHAESDWNTTGAGTDDRDFWQLTGNVTFDPELAAERDRQHSRGIVVTKCQRHLEIMRGVFAVGVNEMAFAKRAGPFQDFHYFFRR